MHANEYKTLTEEADESRKVITSLRTRYQKAIEEIKDLNEEHR